MGGWKMYVESDLVFYNEALTDQNDVFNFMADKLEEKDYVTKGFREAIKKREEEFPTGLKLGELNVAIAHTEIEYSKTQKLVVIKLKKPVEFRNIEDLEPIQVDIVFGIILNESEKHLEVLQKLSQLLQDKTIISDLKQVQSQSELFEIMNNHFNK